MTQTGYFERQLFFHQLRNLLKYKICRKLDMPLRDVDVYNRETKTWAKINSMMQLKYNSIFRVYDLNSMPSGAYIAVGSPHINDDGIVIVACDPTTIE